MKKIAAQYVCFVLWSFLIVLALIFFIEHLANQRWWDWLALAVIFGAVLHSAWWLLVSTTETEFFCIFFGVLFVFIFAFWSLDYSFHRFTDLSLERNKDFLVFGIPAVVTATVAFLYCWKKKTLLSLEYLRVTAIWVGMVVWSLFLSAVAYLVVLRGVAESGTNILNSLILGITGLLDGFIALVVLLIIFTAISFFVSLHKIAFGDSKPKSEK